MTNRPIFLILLFLLCSLHLNACTAFGFIAGNRTIVGKNYDWKIGDGMVFENPRNLKKTAFRVPRPVSWTARYGSVTFCQYGREFPQSGMNEKGLVVEVLWLDAARYESEDNRPEIDNAQWVQYQLDRSATVEEVIATLDSVRIRPVSPTSLHYFAADRSGNYVVIEYLDGESIVYHGPSLPVAVLSNSTYEQSLQALDSIKMTGNSISGPGSLARFVRAAKMMEQVSGNPVTYAFSVLESVAAPGYTRWSIVYDVTGSTIHYRSHSSPSLKTIDTRKLGFTCSGPLWAASLHRTAGPVMLRRGESEQIRSEAVRTAFAKTPFLRLLGDEFLNAVISYPQTLVCGEQDAFIRK